MTLCRAQRAGGGGGGGVGVRGRERNKWPREQRPDQAREAALGFCPESRAEAGLIYAKGRRDGICILKRQHPAIEENNGIENEHEQKDNG